MEQVWQQLVNMDINQQAAAARMYGAVLDSNAHLVETNYLLVVVAIGVGFLNGAIIVWSYFKAKGESDAI